MLTLPSRFIAGIAAAAALASAACSAPSARPTAMPTATPSAPTVAAAPTETGVTAARPLFIDFYAPF